MARFRLELGPVPLHHQVYLDLRAALDAGEWRPGDRLPAGARARRALRLQPDHRPARPGRAGPRGAARADARPRHVRPPPADRARLRRRSCRSPRRCSAAASTRRRASSPPGPSRPARPSPRRSGIEPGSPTLYLERLRLADGEPLLLEQVHLPAERFPGLLASRPRARLAVRPARPTRYGTRDRPRPRGARAGPAARPRGAPARPASRARRRC